MTGVAPASGVSWTDTGDFIVFCRISTGAMMRTNETGRLVLVSVLERDDRASAVSELMAALGLGHEAAEKYVSDYLADLISNGWLLACGN